jgi:integration host factor subunit alpha
MALTKAEMSEYLFDKLGLSKRDAKELVELFFEEIRRALENGEQVNSPGSATSICGIKTNARDVTRRRGGYSHYSPARGDLQTRSEVEKPCRKRVAERQII